ncbi:uncharacterized protein EV420DRAFT_1636486 [Desarmillaria tabescens]|uniref:DUF6534 domain-containing protein n=1 Tax=Armillaria tabescens TaxID=1929756 RepID=A0AA39TTG8_ARMTA|nr:uncharacterized protein EV420DRAFT_1636486 [Desarmillaria tabescens]KAK0465928.1 hypothetical protein EV420DRAFT_1636486 [Desarmillaria tabescens]
MSNLMYFRMWEQRHWRTPTGDCVIKLAVSFSPPARSLDMGQYDQSLGAILIGSWFNAMFYMLELWQGYIFFSTFRGDTVIIKSMVLISLLVDTLGTANNCACIYLYTVTHWGDMEYILVQNWAVPAYVILSGISACNVQLFLSYRFWTLARNLLVTIMLMTFSFASLGGAIANGITVVQHSDYAERNFNIKTVTIWLVASAVADISIASALIFQLRSSKPVFKETKALIRRLTVMAVKTGTVTTVLAILCRELSTSSGLLCGELIGVRCDSNSVSPYRYATVTVGFGFCLGRVYALTMLYNLNTRVKGRQRTDTTVYPQEGGSGGFSLRNINSSDLGGISVHRTAIVRIDGSEGYGTETSSAPDVVRKDSDSRGDPDDKNGSPV